jgi:hypothetical protein
MLSWHAPQECLICRDINTHYLSESNRKKQLSSLLTTYNLPHTVNFATRIQNRSSTTSDNIFVDNSRLGSSITTPLINGLSGHDAQLQLIIYMQLQQSFTKTENKINKQWYTHKLSDTTKTRNMRMCPSNTRY